MMQSEQLNELAAALAKAQAVMENAVLNKTNPHFKSRYADLASVLDAIRKPLATHGIAIVQTIHDELLRTTLVHTSGQWIAGEYRLPIGVTPQQMGSALTYARRYSLSAITGIAADEDDDANAAQGTKRAAPKIGPNVLNPPTPHMPGHGIVPQGYTPPAPSQPDAAGFDSPQQEPAVTHVPEPGGGLPIHERATPMPRIATEAFKVASNGMAEYERWYLALSNSERKQLLPYHLMIKGAAAEADDIS